MPIANTTGIARSRDISGEADLQACRTARSGSSGQRKSGQVVVPEQIVRVHIEAVELLPGSEHEVPLAFLGSRLVAVRTPQNTLNVASAKFLAYHRRASRSQAPESIPKPNR